jgi:hypothetical protein
VPSGKKSSREGRKKEDRRQKSFVLEFKEIKKEIEDEIRKEKEEIKHRMQKFGGLNESVTLPHTSLLINQPHSGISAYKTYTEQAVPSAGISATNQNRKI